MDIPLEVTQSKIEDAPEIAEAVQRARSRNPAKLARNLLQSVISQRRDRWADVVLRTALWTIHAFLTAGQDVDGRHRGRPRIEGVRI
jgi:hypothetical protein